MLCNSGIYIYHILFIQASFLCHSFTWHMQPRLNAIMSVILLSSVNKQLVRLSDIPNNLHYLALLCQNYIFSYINYCVSLLYYDINLCSLLVWICVAFLCLPSPPTPWFLRRSNFFIKCFSGLFPPHYLFLPWESRVAYFIKFREKSKRRSEPIGLE